MVLAVAESLRCEDFETALEERVDRLVGTRPTATNLSWAVDRILNLLNKIRSMGNSANAEEQIAAVRTDADLIADEDAAACERIGEFGLELIRRLAEGKSESEPVNILTHCNAGWLAFVDHGSATAPIYAAHRAGIPVHVWVDETPSKSRCTADGLGVEPGR